MIDEGLLHLVSEEALYDSVEVIRVLEVDEQIDLMAAEVGILLILLLLLIGMPFSEELEVLIASSLA